MFFGSLLLRGTRWEVGVRLVRALFLRGFWEGPIAGFGLRSNRSTEATRRSICIVVAGPLDRSSVLLLLLLLFGAPMKSSGSLNHGRDYTPVASTDPSSSAPPAPSSSQASRTVLEKVTDKAIAAVWVIVAALVIYWTDSLHVLLLLRSSSSTATRTANPLLMMWVAIGFGINTVLILYLIVYLPYVKGLNDSSAWEVYCPRIIPTITLIGVITGFLLIRATWSVWGFLSPLILGIEAMGCLFLLHFIPVWPQ